MTAVIEKKKKRLVWLKRDWRLYLMLILPIAQYILFRYLPMQGILIAFQKYNLFKGIWGSKWVGMDNFKFVFSLKDFTLSLRNTLFLNFLDLIAGFPVPIILAIMLTEMRSVKLKRVSQTLLYLPHFLSWVIIGGMVSYPQRTGRSLRKPLPGREMPKNSISLGRGFSLFWGFRESRRMTQESAITTELCSGFQGLGGGANQQAFCNSARMALLATIISNS